MEAVVAHYSSKMCFMWGFFKEEAGSGNHQPKTSENRAGQYYFFQSEKNLPKLYTLINNLSKILMHPPLGLHQINTNNDLNIKSLTVYGFS